MSFNNIQDIIDTNPEFGIVHSTDQLPLASSDTRRICILDSSFNPPHLAHYALAKEALAYKYNDKGENPQKEISLILLLSIKNADKGAAPLNEVAHRLVMMRLMADYLHENLGVHVSIAVTNHAKFVDKSASVLNWLKTEVPNEVAHIKLTFLVGFDTLVRIFDPKYYVPDRLLDSLREFMETTDLFCLTRKDNLVSYHNQVNYVTRMRHGLIAAVPLAWSNSVHLFTFPTAEENDRLGAVSSSSIRTALADDNQRLEGLPLIPLIKSYIRQNNLYQ